MTDSDGDDQPDQPDQPDTPTDAPPIPNGGDPDASRAQGMIDGEWWDRADEVFPEATSKTELLRRVFETGVRYRERERREQGYGDSGE